MIRAFILLAAFVGTAASAQYQPYPYPPHPVRAIRHRHPVIRSPAIRECRARFWQFRCWRLTFGRRRARTWSASAATRYVLTPQAQATLTAQAQWLIQHPFVRASIEGHADVRQTRDYAFALGERRAAAVRNYLIAQASRREQLQTVSWGRERPTTAAAHDATWLQNSRVVTVLKQPQQSYLPPSSSRSRSRSGRLRLRNAGASRARRVPGAALRRSREPSSRSRSRPGTAGRACSPTSARG